MKTSAGILIYRFNQGKLEIFLVHPGGPFFKNKDNGFWSIPKGENGNEDNDLFQTALRELKEETGIDLFSLSEEKFTKLGFIAYKNYKQVYAWAIEYNLPENFEIKSNLFELEFKKGSGKKYQFPEIDRGGFFPVEIAKQKIHSSQKQLIERLEEITTDKTQF
ncbi:MAG: NUDIX domain-containing protein [Patescibacteria group bacterium]